MFTNVPVLCEWVIRELSADGSQLLNEKHYTNVVTDDGRSLFLENLFGLAGSSIITALCVGACTTAASHTDTQLNYELIGNATRKSLTNTSGAALSASDITSDTYTSGGVTYYKKIVVSATYSSGDGNNGNQFGEYGLNTLLTNPATPTSSSGVMMNHLVDPAPTIKTSGNQIQVQITLRY